MGLPDKKEKLFDLYSNQLGQLLPQFAGKFLCPYCLKPFTKADLTPDSKTNEAKLTYAHIIPKASESGNQGVLACRDCNNSIGELIEAPALNHWNIEDFANMESNKPLNGFLNFNGIEFAGSISGFGEANAGYVIKMVPKASKPGAVEKANAELYSAITNNQTFNFSIVTNEKYGNSYLRNICVLNMGYLRLFQFLGYGYILSKALNPIRMQITSPDQTFFKVPFAYPYPYFSLEEGLNIVDSGFFPPAFVFQWREVLAFLPMNTDVNLDIYYWLNRYHNYKPNLPRWADVMPKFFNVTKEPHDTFRDTNFLKRLGSENGLSPIFEIFEFPPPGMSEVIENPISPKWTETKQFRKSLPHTKSARRTEFSKVNLGETTWELKNE